MFNFGGQGYIESHDLRDMQSNTLTHGGTIVNDSLDGIAF